MRCDVPDRGQCTQLALWVIQCPSNLKYKKEPTRAICAMLILVLAWFLFKHHGVSAVPFVCHGYAPPTASKTLLGIEIGGASGRSLFSIIWACFSTTFICTWVSVHPNIPPLEGNWKSFIRRLKLMFWALIAPELILAWAVKQWAAAANVATFYNESRHLDENGTCIYVLACILILESISDPKKWTRTHGFFLLMGGFKLISYSFRLEDYYSGEVLSFERFKVLIRRRGISVGGLEIDAEEIKDKSKGDLLSKTIAILQTTWFIAQCIARVVQGLALTELELVTIALASLNAITYFFWWNKPLDVKSQVSVYTDSAKGVDPQVNLTVPNNNFD